MRPVAYDLATETEGFSGADIAGLVRCAGSRALARVRKDGTGVECIILTLDDVRQAIDEVVSDRSR
jgi:SpoVK/Ycf46/Vps4 family AAA+-type ATPase